MYVSEGDPVVQLLFFASHGKALESNEGASDPREIRGNIAYSWIARQTPARAEKFDSCVPPD